MRNRGYILVCLISIFILISGCLTTTISKNYHIEDQNGTPLSFDTVCISRTNQPPHSDCGRVTDGNGNISFNWSPSIFSGEITYTIQVQDLNSGQIYHNNRIYSTNGPDNMTLVLFTVEPSQIPTQTPNLLETFVDRVNPNLVN
jgi:hypothetical protein